MIDVELITRKIALITSDLDALGILAKKSLEAYSATPTDEIVAERYLERVIGRMIDINYHLITEAGHPPPRDYHESFTQLGKLGVLPAPFASQMAACAGLRNRIVHDYDEIDPTRVYEALQEAVRDIPEYLRHILAHVQALP